MKKLIGIILSVTFIACFFACDTETYTDKLNKERKAIEKFIADNDIDVVYEFPEGPFKENVYFKDRDTGIYIHVVDPGNDERPTKDPRTPVYLRYDTVYNLVDMTPEAYPNITSEGGVSFRYGNSNTYTSTSSSSSAAYVVLSQGCVIPLDYGLGNNAVIKLIVPFESGSTYQLDNYKTLYFSRLKYRFVLDKPEE